VGNGQDGSAPEPGGGGVLVAIDGRSRPAAAVARVAAEVLRRFPSPGTAVLAARQRGGEVVLAPPEEAAPETSAPHAAPFPGGGVPGSESPLGALLREGDRRGAAALALVAAEERDGSADWLGLLLGPILEGAADFVSPAYRRGRAEGLLNTGVVYPLTRALYGWRLRQPMGEEAALSLPLARRLLLDPDWRRRPEDAGSDAWLVAKVLAAEAPACQAWLGAWPRPDGPPEEASQALARVLGPVFRVMEGQAERWQRVDGSLPLPSSGAAGILEEAPARLRLDRLEAAFRLGLRELEPVWGLVLPAATRLALRRLAAQERLALDDSLWARTVYDFAVAHYTRTVERRQLLLSMTPLYLGWVAGFLAETQDLTAGAVEARIESLCGAFEREKGYLISRWRWPDSF
jgi:hypothetical protein